MSPYSLKLLSQIAKMPLPEKFAYEADIQAIIELKAGFLVEAAIELPSKSPRDLGQRTAIVTRITEAGRAVLGD